MLITAALATGDIELFQTTCGEEKITTSEGALICAVVLRTS